MYTDDILTLLWKHAPLIVIHITIGALLGLGTAVLGSPVYTSTASGLVAAEGNAGARSVTSANTIITAVMPTLAKIGTSNSVLTEVANSTGIDKGEIEHSISVSNTENSLIIEVTAQSSSPERAQKIAAAEIEAIRNIIGTLSVRAQEEASLTLTDIDTASLPASPSAPSRKRNSLYGAILGGAAGLIVALSINYSRRQTEEDDGRRAPTTYRKSALPGMVDPGKRA
ncbi:MULTISPECIES: YveK family protein [Actinomyces]|uniref:YveK family protein n=1 Tax=Actinomyces TaxID=1654 RepID=UPI0014460477|nr:MULTISPECIES: Wzz/FepE/Etk N-terminal domain-containing protein [Actinomyces]